MPFVTEAGHFDHSNAKVPKAVGPDRLPWYAWPFVPFGYLIFVLLLMVLGPLALLSIPYFLVFPDRHAHPYDVGGTPRQQEQLKRWREHYARLSFVERIGRARKLFGRRRARSRIARRNEAGTTSDDSER